MTGGWIGRALVATLAFYAFDLAALVAHERLSRRDRNRRRKNMRPPAGGDDRED